MSLPISLKQHIITCLLPFIYIRDYDCTFTACTPQVSLANNTNTSFILGGIQVSGTISKSDFEDDKFLKPVLEDDALLISLDDLPELSSPEAPAKDTEPSTNLVTRVSELEEELRRIQSQFDNYRSTVEETLDERWNDKSKGNLQSPTIYAVALLSQIFRMLEN